MKKDSFHKNPVSDFDETGDDDNIYGYGANGGDDENDDDAFSFDSYDDDSDSEVENSEVDLTAAGFPEITKKFEPVPHKVFTDPNYYKTVISDEGEKAQRVHTLLQKYLNAKDPKDRSVFRPQLITAFWEFLRDVARKTPMKLPEAKKFLLRFNFLHPNFVKPETKDFFAKLVTENELNQPVYYVDEWFRGVGTGVIRASTTDEVKVSRSNTGKKIQQLLEKASGKLDGFKTLLKGKAQERRGFEELLQDQISVITEHVPVEGLDDVSSPYSEHQKRSFTDIQETIRGLLKSDRELNSFLKDYNQADADVTSLRNKMEEGGGEEEGDGAAS